MIHLRSAISLFALALALPLTAISEEGTPIVTGYAARDIGASAQSWVTTQDSNDVFYFGCDEVLSFDGERWKEHRVPGSYVVRGLAFGSNGRLWVGAFNEVGYFDRTEKGLSEYHSLIGFLPEKERAIHDVWYAFPRGEGAVFVASDSVLVWDGSAFKTYSLPGARRLTAFQVDGSIYVGHTPTGVWVLGNDGFHLFKSAEDIDHAAFVWMEKGPTHWLMATTKGIFTYDGEKLREFGEGLSEFIRKNTLISVCRLANEDLCIGSFIGGIAIAGPTGKIKRIVGPEDGLLSRSVYSLYPARDGSLWATSAVGITRVLASAGVSLFDARRGLTGKPSYSITQSGLEIMVSNAEGIFSLNIGENSTGRFDALPGLPGRYTDLLTFPADIVYASGFKRVDRLNAGRVTKVFSTINDVYMIRPSAHVPGTFLAASGYEILRLRSQTGNEMQATVLSHVPDRPTTLAEAPNGDVWLGTQSKGAFAVPYKTNSQAQTIPVGNFDAAKDSSVVMVARIGDKMGVFSKKGTDLYSVPNQKPTTLDVVPKSDVLAISNADPTGALWIAYGSPFSDGIQVPVIGRLSVEANGTASWKPFAVPGLSQIGEITSLFVDNRGVVWLGGSEGLLRIEPERVELIGTPRAPLLQSSVEQDQQVAAADNMIDFNFSAVDFGRRSSFRFETRLSGGNNDWSAPNNDNHLRLAGLQSGHYDFAVRTINDAGVAGPASVMRFTVLPPWYKTVPALVCFVLLIAAGFYGALQWRLAYLRRQNVRLETLVKKKTEQLEKANEAKSEFLANMSHEIRNPISGILGLSMAFDETPMDARQKHLASSISSCANLLATLVDDVLDFSKIEAGKIELRSAPFSIRNLLEQCVAMVDQEAREKGSNVTISVAGRLPEQFVGDSARVQQIVLNFLTNALKFGAGKPIVVGATPGFHDRVRFFVRDQGAGMTEAERSSLFTKFTRLESARAANIRGTGLGLAVCKLLAGKMGGRVGVESSPGEGSNFWAEIPFIEVKDPSTSEAPKSGKTTTLRALIVEDIDYNVIAMQAVLRKLEIQSDVVMDGNAALARLQSSFYDVAFLDWNLPGLVGTEVASRYRAIEPATRRTIIIATTAHSADFNREACLAAGMDAFISKPITPAKIAAALRDLGGSLRTAGSIEVTSQNITLDPPGDIDLEMLRFLGNETLEGMGSQIDRFLASFDADRATAKAIIETGEPAEIHRIAHRLLSHCSVVKHPRLSQLAASLQRSSASASRERIQQLFAEFEAEFTTFKYKLESIRASIGPA